MTLLHRMQYYYKDNPLQAYRAKLKQLLSPSVYLVGEPNGDTFKDLIGGTVGFGTNTANNGLTTLGETKIGYDGSTSHCDWSALAPAAFPGTYSMLISILMNDWADDTSVDFWRIVGDGAADIISLYKNGSNALGYHYEEDDTQTLNSVDASGYSGLKHVFLTVDTGHSYVYVDGASAFDNAVGGGQNDAVSFAQMGASDGTPSTSLDGDIVQMVWSPNVVWSPTLVSQAHALRGGL